MTLDTDIETIRGSQNLLTPHGPGEYPGLAVIRPGPGWDLAYLVLADGQSFIAHGGERMYSFESPAGARADGLTLSRGDHATKVRSDLPFYLAEWRIERNGRRS